MKSHFFSTLLLITFATLSLSLQAQEQPFTIKGKFSEFQLAEKVYIQYVYNKSMVKDSAVIMDNKFEFSGKIDVPVKVQLNIPTYEKSKATTDFFIEPSQTTEITVTKYPKEAGITGGMVQKDFLNLKSRLTAHDDKYRATVDEYMKFKDAKNEEGMKSLEVVFDELSKMKKQVLSGFISDKPTSFVSFSSLLDISYMIDEDFLSMYDKLAPEHKSSAKGKELESQIEKTKKTFVGQPIMPFTQKDTSGVDFSIASLKGKYVLIDFWASWCGPCRKENPNIVKAYKNYKDNNFEILGVSLDNKRDPWIAAIHKDELTWYHVSDLKGWKNEVSEMFGIRSIPQNLLIDPEGKIIARNITGHELDAALTKHLKGL
jgi:thiol-disulfide isomerase/thioredoxin